MSLIGLIVWILVVFIVVGVLLWLVNAFIPMEPRLKSAMNTIIIAVVVIAVVLWLLSAFGFFGSVGTITVPRVR